MKVEKSSIVPDTISVELLDKLIITRAYRRDWLRLGLGLEQCFEFRVRARARVRVRIRVSA